MDNKIVKDDDLPDGWIRKQSKKQPDRVYYYNTATRQSQWTSPASVGDKHENKLTKKGPAASRRENDNGAGNSFRISDRSKQIKKRQSKTPAQDRLQSRGTQIKNSTPIQDRLRNSDTLHKNVTPVRNRLQYSETKMKNASETMNRAGKAVDSNQSTANNCRRFSVKPSTLSNPNQAAVAITKPRPVHSNKTNAVESIDEIPSLFPPRTPGQERLNRLRFSLNSGHTKPSSSESSQHALSVIRSEFGLSSPIADNNSQNSTIDEDEPMDWEPCDIFEQIETIVYKDFLNPFIIPDTNVFLDELSCISDTIRKDSKYNVLVPFVVLQELDRLKGRPGDSRISSLATGAIRFIYNELKSKTQRLQGQTATKDCEHLIDVLNADDRILNCCLQILRQSPETILVSNDINLCNKAMASGITTMTAKEYKATCN